MKMVLLSHDIVPIGYFLLWLNPQGEVKMLPGGIDMTDLQVEALLYGGGKVETEGFVISSWFDDSTSEKNIEILNKETKRISCFVANGMSLDELKKKLERRIRA